jgi:hypothetical protein
MGELVFFFRISFSPSKIAMAIFFFSSFVRAFVRMLAADDLAE